MKILSFDVESNGLQGAGFAVAGLLLDDGGNTITSFAGRCPIKGPVDEFVAAEVLPQFEDLQADYASAHAMRTAFWSWYLEAKAASNMVVVQNGYPVEARFLIACQEDDLAARYWDHPFPMIDLTSLLWQIGGHTREEREKFFAAATAGAVRRSHDPRYDAWAAATTAMYALRQAGQLD